MKYYKKSLPGTPITLSNGKRFKFEKYPDGFGYLSSEDNSLTRDLDICAARHVGGVTVITQETYEAALKKNSTLKPRERQSSRHSVPRLTNLGDQPVFQGRTSEMAGAVVKAASEAKRTLPVKPGMPLAAMRGKWVPTAVKM